MALIEHKSASKCLRTAPLDDLIQSCSLYLGGSGALGGQQGVRTEEDALGQALLFEWDRGLEVLQK